MVSDYPHKPLNVSHILISCYSCHYFTPITNFNTLYKKWSDILIEANRSWYKLHIQYSMYISYYTKDATSGLNVYNITVPFSQMFDADCGVYPLVSGPMFPMEESPGAIMDTTQWLQSSSALWESSLVKVLTSHSAPKGVFNT